MFYLWKKFKILYDHVAQKYGTLAENKHVPKIHDTYDPTYDV